MDGKHISVTGTVSIYTDVILEGGSTITSSGCISAYNNSRIVVDLTSRPREEYEVLSYNCVNVPDLDVDLRGSYADGCIPRYNIRQTSLTLLFDTPSCKEENLMDATQFFVAGVIAVVVAIIVIIGLSLLLLARNKRDNVSVVQK